MRIAGPWTPGYYQGWLKPARLDGYVLTPMRMPETMRQARAAIVEKMYEVLRNDQTVIASLERLAEFKPPEPDPSDLLDRRCWPRLHFWDGFAE